MAASTANVANLTAAMEKYCVPKCTSGCSEMLLADYKVPAGSSVGTCVCKSTNLQYDPASRECIVHCPIGTYAYASHEACPAGTYAHNGACPKGSYGTAGACSTVGKYKFSIE